MAAEVATATSTSFQVHEELESLLERDLLGPWDGPEEELPPGPIPAERHLLDRLVPRSLDTGQPLPEPPDDDTFHEPG